jgi:starch synthase (maltosyl-transferring)
LTKTEVREYFRPNLWPNTPDILPGHLQGGARSVFVARLVLAATLGASYGIYGPAYETLEHVPREPGSEEYLDSEKYEQRLWQLDRPDGLAGVIAAVNRARRENPALQSDRGLRFHPTDNDQLICYSKQNDDASNVVLVVVNLSFHEGQHGYVDLGRAGWKIDLDRGFEVEDLLSGRRFHWQGARNFVDLDPAASVAHVFRVLPTV